MEIVIKTPQKTYKELKDIPLGTMFIGTIGDYPDRLFVKLDIGGTSRIYSLE